MELFRQCINIIVALITQYRKFISRKVFLGLSASTIHAQKNVFSFKLFKRYIDRFSFMWQLITMAGSNFLDG